MAVCSSVRVFKRPFVLASVCSTDRVLLSESSSFHVFYVRVLSSVCSGVRVFLCLCVLSVSSSARYLYEL